jgi:hypothetical protein
MRPSEIFVKRICQRYLLGVKILDDFLAVSAEKVHVTGIQILKVQILRGSTPSRQTRRILTGTHLGMNLIPKETVKCTVSAFQDPFVTSSIIVGLLRPVSITPLTALLPSAGISNGPSASAALKWFLCFRYWGNITPAQQRQLTSQTLQTFEIVERSRWQSVTNGKKSSQIIILYLRCRSFVTS